MHPKARHSIPACHLHVIEMKHCKMCPDNVCLNCQLVLPHCLHGQSWLLHADVGIALSEIKETIETQLSRHNAAPQAMTVA